MVFGLLLPQTFDPEIVELHLNRSRVAALPMCIFLSANSLQKIQISVNSFCFCFPHHSGWLEKVAHKSVLCGSQFMSLSISVSVLRVVIVYLICLSTFMIYR